MAQADFTRISTNIAALNNLNSLRAINTKLGTAQLRLATGKRINQASDDPAGLTIAMKLNARNEGLKASLGNIGDAKNMLSVAEGGLQQINDLLIEMKSKATSAASDTIGDDERAAFQQQLQSLAKQINDIVGENKWNGTSLLDGNVDKTLQTGASETDITRWVLNTGAAGDSHNSMDIGVATGSLTEATLAVARGTTVDDSFDTSTEATGAAAATSFDGLTEIDTGTYKFKVADTSTDADTGKAIQLNTPPAQIEEFTGTSDATSTHGLASGTYKLTAGVSATAAAFDYTITDTKGNVIASALAVDASSTAALEDASGNSLGIDIKLSADMATGDVLDFEYIAGGQVKMELYQVSGTTEELVDVDDNGADDTTDVSASKFYMSAGTSYDIGRGLEVSLQAFDSIMSGDISKFVYTQSGDVSVDVSSAEAARDYMVAVDGAIAKVSGSLNNIGSLVGRLNSKEITVSVDQVNTEASYNRIMNADMAYEQVESAKYQILQQTAVAMLAQANSAPQGILSLFR
ncbi:MAG: Flagellin [Candidatus Poribacteria bacterium]|nr:Flagellin [Candidatus Poribacteria bacterium]